VQGGRPSAYVLPPAVSVGRSKGVKGRACGPLRGGPCPRCAAGRASRPCDP